jgi:hypothetical protein
MLNQASTGTSQIIRNPLRFPGTIKEISILLKKSGMFSDYMQPWDGNRVDRRTARHKHGVASFTNLPVLFFA